MSQITVHKRNHVGEQVFHYDGQVIERGPTWVCLRAAFNLDKAELGFVTFRRGDMFTEWFFSDRWYNIFEVHDGDTERIKGWYCNITRPAHISDDVIEADDLALDIFITPNGTILMLDEQEFTALDLPLADRMATLDAVQHLRRLVAGREPPFDRIS